MASRLNGNVKWIITLIITTAVAAIAYGRQIQKIENLEQVLMTKADSRVVAEKLVNLDACIDHVKDDMQEIKSDIKTIQVDMKKILIKVE
ncbi:MAG: hypothetical protein ACTSQB_00140 [Candidatus Heimdallarchaeota archaeon]